MSLDIQLMLADFCSNFFHIKVFSIGTICVIFCTVFYILHVFLLWVFYLKFTCQGRYHQNTALDASDSHHTRAWNCVVCTFPKTFLPSATINVERLFFTSICHSVHGWGGDLCGREACVVRGMHGRGCAWQRACLAGGICGRVVHGRRACMAGGGHVRQGACMTGEMATAADDTHPTGMYSCMFYIRNII